MTQEELITKYEEIQDQKVTKYFKPYRHFVAAKKFYEQLQDGIADEYTFFTETMVTFHECEDPGRDPDFTSMSGSRYWYYKDGVIRGSDHWGNGVALCDWALKTKQGKTLYGYDHDCPTHLSAPRFGFAKWEDFLFKASLIEANGQKAVTTFNNTLGYGIFEIGGKVYKRVISESYIEDDGE
mgnify:CR=1 FL=1